MSLAGGAADSSGLVSVSWLIPKCWHPLSEPGRVLTGSHHRAIGTHDGRGGPSAPKPKRQIRSCRPGNCHWAASARSTCLPLALSAKPKNSSTNPVTDEQVAAICNHARAVPGFTIPDAGRAAMWPERARLDGATQEPDVRVNQNGLLDRNDASTRIDALRDLPAPEGVTVRVGGTPALEHDGIHGLFDKLPVMLLVLITTTTLLMFLAFGSVVLPIKAAIMSVLTLGATMGVLTAMFVDGLFANWLNFTPQPLSAPVLGLVIAIIYGLCTDYEVFLVSRMIEARAQGMSTTEAIRIGAATTGRLIAAAALILVVVAGAFVFSELVMLKYLAFGLLTALLVDATVIRMFLVPALMKWLGDECWWAPRWMKQLQQRIGLGDVHLPDEADQTVTRRQAPAHVTSPDGRHPLHPNMSRDRQPKHSARRQVSQASRRSFAHRPTIPQPDDAPTTPLLTPR